MDSMKSWQESIRISRFSSGFNGNQKITMRDLWIGLRGNLQILSQMVWGKQIKKWFDTCLTLSHITYNYNHLSSKMTIINTYIYTQTLLLFWLLFVWGAPIKSRILTLWLLMELVCYVWCIAIWWQMCINPLRAAHTLIYVGLRARVAATYCSPAANILAHRVWKSISTRINMGS